ncbi:uncharacterized protein LOC117612783, partial [Prunus dulcis]|uniref:uncharacterized protein LOC117612783 n=1 Tax=Prunus dulcis TaxID=3755 RepID=UPI0014823962
MPGIAPEVISHKLSISPAYKPVRQKRRLYDTERYEAMRTEVDKLQTIGFIREATYPVWLANSVMVRKSTGGWRMCQDYTDLNKACPKDSFPLPRIDQLVDATAGHELLSFMDAYSGYNQIFMHPPDSEHTAFITDKGLYCYNVMPFEKAELPIFYVSKALQSAELRYPPLEQLALALVVSARRLRPYCQAHGIKVLTNQPLRQVLQKSKISGRLIKWAIELEEFDIQIVLRPAEKGQAVADFISELTPSTAQSTPEAGLHVDGSANQQGCGAGLVLTTPDGLKIEYALRFNFRTSNNEAEYEALLAGLRLAKSMNAKQIRIHSDSQLIVNQVTADFAAKDASMHAYLSTAHQLLQSFQAYKIKQIPRGENSHADALARLASAINDKVGRKVPVEILAQPSTVASETCTVRYEDTWMSHIYLYLTNGTLPEDKAQARKLRYRSARYTVINNVLYKRGYTTPYLKCLTAEQGDYVLREIHNGVCGDHSGSRSLAYKAFRQGYFWPTMHQDANSLVKKCDKCQRFGNVPHIPAEPLTPIVSPWPFAQWGLDLIGPMPQGKGQ